MGLQTVLIADSSDDFLLAMAQSLQQRFRVLCCQDGKQALALLRSEKIDLFILALALPELDGITLLETIAAENIHPVVLATTLLLNDYVCQSIQRLHVSYLIYKPASIAAVTARVEDLLAQDAIPTREQQDRLFLEEKLTDFGLKLKLDGSNYLLAGIPSHAKNPRQTFTKELYPSIGKQFGCSVSSVDRSIRYALKQAWENRTGDVWEQYFPDFTDCPANSDFIRRMSEELRKTWE